jgi:hypothetical protein
MGCYIIKTTYHNANRPPSGFDGIFLVCSVQVKNSNTAFLSLMYAAERKEEERD